MKKTHPPPPIPEMTRAAMREFIDCAIPHHIVPHPEKVILVQTRGQPEYPK